MFCSFLGGPKPRTVTQARWPVKSDGHLLLPASATWIPVNSPMSVPLPQISIFRAPKLKPIKIPVLPQGEGSCLPSEEYASKGKLDLTPSEINFKSHLQSPDQTGRWTRSPGWSWKRGASSEHGRGAGAPAKGNPVSRSLVRISEVLLLVQDIPGYTRMWWIHFLN